MPYFGFSPGKPAAADWPHRDSAIETLSFMSETGARARAGSARLASYSAHEMLDN